MYGRVLHFSNYSLNLQDSCSTDHKLNVQIGNELYCAPLTTTWSDNSLHVEFGGTTYTVCNGECPGSGGGGEWVMPEEPEEPIVLPSSCTWTQTNENAYLLSDGNQYFDTGVLLDATYNIEVTVQVINGKSAKIFGSANTGTSCTYDMTIRNDGAVMMRMGKSPVNKRFDLDATTQIAKNVFKTTTVNATKNYKNFYINGEEVLSAATAPKCTSTTYTFLVLKNNFLSVNNSQNGGIKLYRIRLWDGNGNLIHDFQPVAQGTNICGTIAATNAMWDFVTKKLYYPGGTGQMGYGVDE